LRLKPEGTKIWPEAVALVAAAITLGTLTYARNADYANYDRIWSKTIAARPRNTRALNNYATSLMTQRRFDEAEERLRTAVAVKPDFAEGHANLGVALCSQGKYTEGIEHLRRSAELDPERAATFRNLAEAYGSIGQPGDALANYTRALALLPDDVGLLNRAAWILATSRDGAVRDGARAREYAERAVRLTNRRDTESLDSLAAARAELADFPGAVAAETEAIAIATANGDGELRTEMEYRLNLYRNGAKFRDSM
ncbi:MAG TPA: tetratricopeptide repeat protein, partial [Vicinamibacterales bacterium]